MFSHITVGTNDIEKARRFYDALFATLGAGPAETDEAGRLVYIKDGKLFMVTRPIDGADACHANGGTIGFTIDSPETVDAWHEAGVGNGGRSIEDPPGVRNFGDDRFYLAYLRDPDGNKLCASHHM